MERRVLNAVNKLKHSLYRSGFFSDDFGKRLKKKLAKGAVTFAMILSVLTTVNKEAKGQFTPTLKELNNYIEHVKHDSNLDSKEREKQYITVSAYSASLADKIFIEISELISKGDVLSLKKAKADINYFRILSHGFSDKDLKNKLSYLDKVLNDLILQKSSLSDAKLSVSSYKTYNLTELMAMDVNQKMIHIKEIGNFINSNPSRKEEAVNYLVKVYLSSNKNLKNLRDGSSHTMRATNVFAEFKRYNNDIRGTFKINDSNYSFSFSLNN